MHPMLNIAIRAARSAGRIITSYFGRMDMLSIDTKARNDFVSEVDRHAEEAIIETIRKAYPHHAILAEESGAHPGDEYEWVIDPLDGTTNFLHSFPHYAVSIALKHKGRLSQGVVYDPIRNELFAASRGEGARLDDRRIRVSTARTLEGALLGTGFPFKRQHDLEMYLETFKVLFPDTSGIRRAGAASLDLAYVAAGRLDGFWELGLSEWDMAAGVLIIQEAGGLVGDWHGGHEFMHTGNIVAGSPKVFRAMLAAIRPHLPQTAPPAPARG